MKDSIYPRPPPKFYGLGESKEFLMVKSEKEIAKFREKYGYHWIVDPVDPEEEPTEEIFKVDDYDSLEDTEDDITLNDLTEVLQSEEDTEELN